MENAREQTSSNASITVFIRDTAGFLISLKFCFAVEGHMAVTGKELLEKLGLGSFKQVRVGSSALWTRPPEAPQIFSSLSAAGD